MPNEIISKQVAMSYFVLAKGYQLSRTWRGYGSTIFFEFGTLNEDQKGEYTLTADDNWSLLIGDQVVRANDEFELIDEMINNLGQQKINEITFEDDSLKYRFDSFIFKLDLNSLNNDKWSFSSEKWGYLSSSNGSFIIEKSEG